MVEPGRRCLGGRYELQRLIAAGGMGQVWYAHDTALQRPVAVKVLRSEYTGDPTFLTRFRAEAQHAAALSHPHIAAVFDYGEETAQDGTGETLAYLVMELVAGEPLSALLRRGPLDAATTLSLLRQTAFALAEAHRAGMVHRDVKPGNILVRPDGRVKITDFGIAWSARSVALTRTGQVIGTPQYLSPEQAEGRPATPASDVYALGLIGYECLTGHPAFDGDNPVTIALKQVRQEPEPLPATVPDGVRELIGRAMTKKPSLRPADGAAFAAAVQDVEAGRCVPASAATLITSAAAPAADQTRQVAAVGGPGTRRPTPRRRGRGRGRGRGAMVLLPLLGLLAGAALMLALLPAAIPRPASAAAQAAGRVGRAGIVLAAQDYLGRPVGAVTAQLLADRLTVSQRADASAAGAPGTVTRLTPAGTVLSPGDTVTLYYVPEPGLPAPDSGRSPLTEAALTSSAQPAATSAAPTTTATAAPTTEAAPGTATNGPAADPSHAADPGTASASAPNTASAAPVPDTTPPAAGTPAAGSTP